MISKKKIREIAKKHHKNVSKKALHEIENMLNKKVERIIEISSRNADFYGRKTIKKEDLD